RDDLVTGVQTCALPIYQGGADVAAAQGRKQQKGDDEDGCGRLDADFSEGPAGIGRAWKTACPPSLLEGDEVQPQQDGGGGGEPRSEEHTSELQSPDHLV